jgi:hypothetical protein
MEYTENQIQAIWEKARGIPDWDTTQWRKDQCGAWIQRQQYNNQHSDFGWLIQNVSPGGSHAQENLQPFHCKNSFDIANGKPHCKATADRIGLSPAQKVDEPRNSLK